MDDYRECWLCGVPLGEENAQYCNSCEIDMLTRLVKQMEEVENENN